MAYRPSVPFNIPMKLLIPKCEKNNGVERKIYLKSSETSDDLLFFGSFRTFGGTETKVNDLLVIENTAVVETWFRPDIKSDCRIVILLNDEEYEIIGTPENIEMRNQFLKFKIKRIGGCV